MGVDNEVKPKGEGKAQPGVKKNEGIKSNYKKRNNKNRSRSKKRNIPHLGPAMTCSICDKNIRDLSSAIINKESGTPSHFDCIIKSIAKKETLKGSQKIVYLGSGKFAIISYENNNNKNFKVIKEIDYEQREDEKPEWRSGLRKEIL